MTPWLVALLGAGAGLSAAALYYNQPILERGWNSHQGW